MASVGALRERDIERHLCNGVKALGGLCYKWVSSSPGVPDRIVILPGGRVVFVELKTEIGRTSPVQRWIIGEMRARGAEVRVIKGIKEVRAFLKEISNGKAQ